MSQSQDWNSPVWQEDRDRDANLRLNCVFPHGLFFHPSATHPWSVLDGDFKASKEKKTSFQTTVLYHRILRCPFCTSGAVCFWWFLFYDVDLIMTMSTPRCSSVANAGGRPFCHELDIGWVHIVQLIFLILAISAGLFWKKGVFSVFTL